MMADKEKRVKENKNIVKVYYHFTFPFLIDYRCGNCFHHLGENLDYSNNQMYKCPECGYINIDNDNSNISLSEYPKIIKKIESEIKELENNNI